MNYEKLTELIASTLNDGKELFELKFVKNNEDFNEDNLIYDKFVHGVVNLMSRTPNTIQMTDNSANGITANGTEVYQIQLLAPITFDDEIKMENQINNFLTIFNNQTIEIEDTTFFTTQTSVINWSKYPSLINGEEYQLIIIQFTAITFTNFLFGNARTLRINNEVLDCIVDVSLSSNKMLNTVVLNGVPVAYTQDNGTQWNLIVDLIYNKNSALHRTLIRDFYMQKQYSIEYKIGALEFDVSNARMQSYVLQDITGDVIKLRLTFTQGGI